MTADIAARCMWPLRAPARAPARAKVCVEQHSLRIATCKGVHETHIRCTLEGPWRAHCLGSSTSQEGRASCGPPAQHQKETACTNTTDEVLITEVELLISPLSINSALCRSSSDDASENPCIDRLAPASTPSRSRASLRTNMAWPWFGALEGGNVKYFGGKKSLFSIDGHCMEVFSSLKPIERHVHAH